MHAGGLNGAIEGCMQEVNGAIEGCMQEVNAQTRLECRRSLLFESKQSYRVQMVQSKDVCREPKCPNEACMQEVPTW